MKSMLAASHNRGILFFLSLLFAFLSIQAWLEWQGRTRPMPAFALFLTPMQQGESAALLVGGRMDLNRAGKRDLMVLPGIGEGLAVRILSYRERYGSFATPGELRNVAGIGPKKVALLFPYFLR